MRLSQFTIEQAGDAIYWIDSGAHIFRVNEAACRLFGCSEAELKALTIYDIYPEYKKEEWLEYWTELKKVGVLQFETYHKNKHGDLVPVEIRANHIEFEGQDLVCHFARDITRRRVMEESLRKGRALLAEAQRLAHLGSWELNLVTDELSWSDEIYRIFGLKPREFGATFEAFMSSVHPDDRDLINQAVDATLYHKKPFNIEHRIVLATGEIRVVCEKAEVDYNEAGEPIRMFGTVQDITEQKRNQEALQASETSLKLAQKLARVGSWERDLATSQTVWSDEIYSVFGYTPGEVTPDFDLILDRVHPDDKEYVKKTFAAALEGEIADGIEYRIVLPNGQIRTVFRLLEIIYDKANKPAKIIGTVQDITERKIAENKIGRLNRLYSVLSGINETIVRIHDVQRLYNEVCRIAVEKGGFRMAWVGIIDEETGQVGAVASAGVVDGYLDNIDINIRNPVVSGGPTGTCIIENRHNICVDFEHDPRMAPWRERALKRGYRSSAAFPLSIGGTVIGAFAFYSGEPAFFSEEEIKLLNSLAEDISFALESIEKEQLLKQAEEVIKSEHQRLYDVLETLPVYVVLLTPDYHVPFANKFFRERYGEAHGRRCYEYLFNRTSPCEACETYKVLEINAPLHWEWTAPDGRIYDIHDYPFTETDGSTLILEMGIDITDQKKAEEELRRSEANLAGAQKLAHVGSWELDLKTSEVYWSDELYRIFGLDPKGPRATAETPLKAVHPDDKAEHRRRFEEGKAGKGHYESEHRIILPNGSERTIHSLAETILDNSGIPIRMIGSAQDITERKEAEIKLHQALAEVERLKARLQAENIYLQEEIKIAHNFDSIISRNETLRHALRKVEQVASTNSTVIILGETGTGKELFARAVHNVSNRRASPLVKVNCAALPANLIESELFGHEKGAFTGALTRKIGRFELADKGTIFLDEIGDLPLELQAKFLRVLQDGEFERLGDSNPIKVDVRVIAATNINLEEAVEKGRFRADLYYRLNVFPINIIPLRERREDISILAKHFFNKYTAKIGKKMESISTEALEKMQAYNWPGNVRELENVIERAVILSTGPILNIQDLPSIKSANAKIETPDGDGEKLQEMEKAHINNILKECNWVIDGKRGAAKRLGIAPSSLRDRMKKLGISRPAD